VTSDANEMEGNSLHNYKKKKNLDVSIRFDLKLNGKQTPQQTEALCSH